MTISNVQHCSNCGACSSICPVKAISVVRDELFYRPAVDERLCISCGKCADICPLNHHREHRSVISAYAARHRDGKIVRKSSSGGVFTALADNVLKQNGVVFGAAYHSKERSVAITSTDDVSLDALRRSKYVESSVGDAFVKVKTALSKKRKVLFCGAPCQVAGLYAFLGGSDDNLLTCDFICGGFASHKMFEEYLADLERRFGGTVRDVNFRPKTYGWREYAIQVRFENGKEYLKPAILDPYFSAFLFRGYSIRENCLNCKFANNHFSDVILSDCWRVSELSKMNDNNTGISLVLVNSGKGEAALEETCETTELEPLPLEQACYNLKPLSFDQDYEANRSCFLEEYARSGIVRAGYQMCQMKGMAAEKLKLKSAIKRIVYSGK